MNVVTVASMLSCIFAAGMAYPGGRMQEYEAETQWHLRAPKRGCIEVSYSFGGNVHRSYACDHENKACIFSAVDRCPASALFYRANLGRIVNIRDRDHLVRYYNQIGICMVMNNMYYATNLSLIIRWRLLLYCFTRLLQYNVICW